MGHAPQSLAKAASERIRSGLSPKTINIAAAVLAPRAKPSRRVGDVSAVNRVRCRSCVAISSARVSQRRASDRSVCFPDATGVSRGPGRSPAQRVTSARSVRACKGSRSTGGALTPAGSALRPAPARAPACRRSSRCRRWRRSRGDLSWRAPALPPGTGPAGRGPRRRRRGSSTRRRDRVACRWRDRPGPCALRQ